MVRWERYHPAELAVNEPAGRCASSASIEPRRRTRVIRIREFQMLSHSFRPFLALKKSSLLITLLALLPSSLSAKVVVLWQPGFPAIASQPLDRATLERALQSMNPGFADLSALRQPRALEG